MLLTRFDPFKQIKDIERSYYKYPDNESVNAFLPIVNTREDETAFYIDVDLPGVDKKDIKVDLNKNILTIWGERKTKKEVKEEDYYKVETTFGKFTRSFTLPENIDIENIQAESNNGVLELVLPKKEEQTNKKSIKIK